MTVQYHDTMTSWESESSTHEVDLCLPHTTEHVQLYASTDNILMNTVGHIVTWCSTIRFSVF